MRKFLLLILMFSFSIFAFDIQDVCAEYNEIEAANLYNNAGMLYQSGDFNKSLEIYEGIIENGIKNPDLFYNASNAAYKSGYLGKAILYLERALNLAPSDSDTIENLAYLNSVKRDSETLIDNIVIAFLSKQYNSININSAALWSVISFALTMLLATLALYFKNLARTSLIVVSLLCTLVFLISTGFFIHKIYKKDTAIEAIIMMDGAKAYSGPGEENTGIFTINEGTKVFIERNQNSWNLIRLKSGAGGWIESRFMENI